MSLFRPPLPPPPLLLYSLLRLLLLLPASLVLPSSSDAAFNTGSFVCDAFAVAAVSGSGCGWMEPQ
jgi:hypothetical protein